MQVKLTAFLTTAAGAAPPPPPQQSRGGSSAPGAQMRLQDMGGVLKLPRMSGHATVEELWRLHSLLESDSGSSEEQLVHALKQLACYECTVEQLEQVPLGARVKALRQHDSPQVAQAAVRLLAKMRRDVASAWQRRANKPKAKQQSQADAAAGGRGGGGGGDGSKQQHAPTGEFGATKRPQAAAKQPRG